MKKTLTVLFSFLLLFSAFSACKKAEINEYSGEPITDAEILSALNNYRAGAFGSRYYSQEQLNNFISLPNVYLYRAENGTGNLYCAYMQTDAFDSSDVSAADHDSSRFSYAAGNDYIDGKHIGFYEGDATKTLLWFKLDPSESFSESCTVKGIEYKLDLVLTEKTYTYLYDCTAGEPINVQTTCFIRLPYRRNGDGTLFPVSNVPQSEQDGYWQGENFRKQSGEYLTAPLINIPKYGALNQLVNDRDRFAVTEFDGRKYMEFPAADGMTKEEFLNFVCYTDDAHRETYSLAFYSFKERAYLDLEILLPLFAHN